MITCQQTAYIQKHFINKTGRLISDLLEMSDKLNVGGFIATMDMEKVFDSLDDGIGLNLGKYFIRN